MKKSYYLFNPGVLERRDNTLKFTPYEEDAMGEFVNPGQPRYLPVEDVGEFYASVRCGPPVPCSISLDRKTLPSISSIITKTTPVRSCRATPCFRARC